MPRPQDMRDPSRDEADRDRPVRVAVKAPPLAAVALDPEVAGRHLDSPERVGWSGVHNVTFDARDAFD